VIDERPARLSTYRQKRDPERTPEPFGGRPASASRLFVVQKHAARRLHYDLRLELGGILRSWAVPKGPSTQPEVKRLAVLVEDHPVEYAEFEGVIPADNYGAGAVIVWDRGTYRPLTSADPEAALARGRLDVELHGYKLRGRWTLARMAGRATRDAEGRNWLLLKKADSAAAAPGAPEPIDRYPESVVSGLTVEEIREVPARRRALAARLATLGAPRRDVAARRQPFMLATVAADPFADPGWLFEPKYDGIRVLAERRGDRVTLYGRSGQVVTARYPDVARALRGLWVEHALLDGEIVATDPEGRPSFQRLQARMGLSRPADVERMAAAVPVVAIFFDCLAVADHDLRSLPLTVRKTVLREILPPLGPVRFGDHVVADGPGLFAVAEGAGLEGIVGKRGESRYRGGRGRDWIKIKCQTRQEFVIGGYTTPRGTRSHLGALHLGLYEDTPDGTPRLRHVAKVGTGFDQASLADLAQRLGPLRRPTSPFDIGSPSGREHHWVEPRLVCEVRFTEWTGEGRLRHPAFLGLREDKPPEACRRERPAAPDQAAPDPVGMAMPAPVEAVAAPPPTAAGNPAATPRVRLTNLDKVFWPAEGYTKGDLVAYYEAIAPRLLPYLRDRPVVLTRYPDGITGKSFFQKDAPDFVPAWIRTARIYSKDAEREIDYFIVNDTDTLRYVVNLGTIPLHLWSARLPHLDRPDWLVLDLDPKGAPFTDVVRVARMLHRLLRALGLPSYVKTSGATGLHVLLPLGARYTHEEARTFARLLATLGVEAAPEIATLARPLGARAGKVYVDYGQNGHGRTIAAPYAVRPLPGAPASCPLAWRDVTARLDPARFTIRTIPRRFARRRDPLAPILRGGIDLSQALARIEARLGR
jgi:bifunctional non-homologous end joining protein LigD